MTKTIEITSDGVSARLVIRRATVSDNMRKSMLAAQAMQNPLEDPAEQMAVVIIYPRCLACIVDGEVDGKPAKDMTAAEFIALPSEIGESWLTAVIELTPSWDLSLPTQAQEDAAQKKE